MGSKPSLYLLPRNPSSLSEPSPRLSPHSSESHPSYGSTDEDVIDFLIQFFGELFLPSPIPSPFWLLQNLPRSLLSSLPGYRLLQLPVLLTGLHTDAGRWLEKIKWAFQLANDGHARMRTQAPSFKLPMYQHGSIAFCCHLNEQL